MFLCMRFVIDSENHNNNNYVCFFQATDKYNANIFVSKMQICS